MKLEIAFQEVRRIFLDTAPVIYFIEQNPTYFAIVDAIFTLAECLILPIRQNDQSQQQLFFDLLTSPDTAEFISTNPKIAHQAAFLRVKYNLKLPDALQISTAIVSHCHVFLTNDTALKRVSELPILVLEDLQL